MPLYYMGRNINIVILDDADGVPGSVCHNADDSYTIFIDAKLCQEKQEKVFHHEMRHILGNDFEKDGVQQIEAETHGWER